MKNPSTALIDNCLQPSTQRTHVSSDSISSTSSQNSTACESLYTTVSVNSLVTSASDRSITSKLSTTASTAMTTPEPPKSSPILLILYWLLIRITRGKVDVRQQLEIPPDQCMHIPNVTVLLVLNRTKNESTFYETKLVSYFHYVSLLPYACVKNIINTNLNETQNDLSYILVTQNL